MIFKKNIDLSKQLQIFRYQIDPETIAPTTILLFFQITERNSRREERDARWWIAGARERIPPPRGVA